MAIKDNSEFAKEVAKNAPDKASVKSLGDAVGMPDKWDKENLDRLISKFNKATFNIEGHTITGKTYIQMCREEAKASHQSTNAFNPYNLKTTENDMRAVTAIPPELHAAIEDTMPTIFRDKKHFGWFVKNFPEFRIAEKY